MAEWAASFQFQFLRLHSPLRTSPESSWWPHSMNYCALLFMLTWPRSQCDAYVEKCSSWVLHKEVHQPKGCTLMYSISITRHFKSRQKAENRDKVEWIEHLRLYLYMQAVRTFSHAWSDCVIIMRQLVNIALCTVIQRLMEAFINGAYYQKFFVAIASWFPMAVNQQIVVRAGISCSTVRDM